MEVPTEAHSISSEGGGTTGVTASGALWRAGLAPALLGGGLALLLAILTGTYTRSHPINYWLTIERYNIC